MPTKQIAIPLNTTLADLDETLHRLLRDELADQKFKNVSIAFDAPKREWAASLSGPTVNLFLYALREAIQRRPVNWGSARQNGRATDVRPPLRVEVSYAVTAWAQSVEDEHRLLSQVMGILFAHRILPEESLVGTLANGSQPYDIETTVGQPRSDDKADFWTAVGGEYKPSLDYVVLVACPSGMTLVRGPDVQAQRFRFDTESHHIVPGSARWEDGTPAPGTWIVLPEDGGYARADAQGHFVLRDVPAGTHPIEARSTAGTETDGTLEVPGARADIVLPLPPSGATTSA
jgi:hypothetical protein